MKALMKFVLAMAMVLMMSGGAMADDFAAQGIVLLPGLTAGYTGPSSSWYNIISLSNITDKEVTCKITVYDHDGNDVTNHGQVYTGSYGITSRKLLSSGVGDFAIPPRSTRLFLFGIVNTGLKTIDGHGVLKWKSTDTDLRRALIGSIRQIRIFGAGSGSNTNVLINNGQPF
ncbi:hypothetical protein [Maridesulfovibrio sp. FT414]|uniref:hypothetical protein n=1 Tax=Maridesulfovibrio sp. FT414 TaxID=2979469 RepID=UPI003D803FE5